MKKPGFARLFHFQGGGWRTIPVPGGFHSRGAG
jgi:hypothetical protein